MHAYTCTWTLLADDQPEMEPDKRPFKKDAVAFKEPFLRFRASFARLYCLHSLFACFEPDRQSRLNSQQLRACLIEGDSC